MKNIKSLFSNLLAVISVASLSLLLQSSNPVPRADHQWHPMRSYQEMQEKISETVWIGTVNVPSAVDNLGTITTCRIPIVPGTIYMYFNSMYEFEYTIRGKGRKARAFSRSDGRHFDAKIISLPNDIPAMIGSDGCVELSYLSLVLTPEDNLLLAELNTACFNKELFYLFQPRITKCFA